MNLEKELDSIKKNIKIPISKIEETGKDEIRIFSSGKDIGTIKIFVYDDEIKYETTDVIVNKLDWSSVYNSNKQEIDDLAQKLFENDIEITLGTFRNLYARQNGDTAPYFLHCEYDDEKWTVKKTL